MYPICKIEYIFSIQNLLKIADKPTNHKLYFLETTPGQNYLLQLTTQLMDDIWLQ